MAGTSYAKIGLAMCDGWGVFDPIRPNFKMYLC